MPMHEITSTTDVLVEASKQPLELFHSIRAMRDSPDVQLNANRVFTCVSKFGESVLGDALAIFDEFAYPLVKDAKVGDAFPFKGFSLRIAGVEIGKIQTHVIDDDGAVRFQVDWNDETPYANRSLDFREAPSTKPGYHFQETLLSANPQKEDKFGIHPIALGFLDYADYFKAMDAISVIREELVLRNAARAIDPKEFNMRRINLINYEQLLALDEGVAGPACHWVVSQILAQSTRDGISAAATRFNELAEEVQKLGVNWGDKFFNYHRDDGYLAMVTSNQPGRTAIFDIWIAWSFKHQGLLTIMDHDAAGNLTDISFSLVSRVNGEILAIPAAVEAGHFEGMPVAKFCVTTGDMSISRDFLESHGFEVLFGTCRHVYGSIQKFNASKKDGKIVSNFDKLLKLDRSFPDEEPEFLSI
jgi:hypothetical protein